MKESDSEDEDSDESHDKETKYQQLLKKHNGNAFLEFGVTGENFFSLERSLIRLFCFLSIIALVQMTIFACFFSEGIITGDHSLWSPFSFASFGEATAICSKAPFFRGMDEIKFGFACDPGYTVQALLTAGSLNDDSTKTAQKRLYDVNKQCVKEDNELSDLIQEKYLELAISSQCFDKAACLATIEIN